MGTRADFYVGLGKEAQWIGSIGMDGYPEENAPPMTCGAITAVTETAFREAILRLSEINDYFTNPSQGWPWPWEDSGLTDYSYCFKDGKVHIFCFGAPYDLANPDDKTEHPKAPWPDMTNKQNVTMGKRSGLLILGRR